MKKRKSALSEKSRLDKSTDLRPHLLLWPDNFCSVQPAQPCVATLRAISTVCKRDLRRASRAREETSVVVSGESSWRRNKSLVLKGDQGEREIKEDRDRWREACEWRGGWDEGWKGLVGSATTKSTV